MSAVDILTPRASMEACKTSRLRDRTTGLLKIMSYIGYILIVVDLVGWCLWFGLSIDDMINDKLEIGVAAFSALAAPHTCIIPSIFGILYDIRDNCANGVCKLSTPAFTWFIFPIFTVPFDFIQYIYNDKYYHGDHWTDHLGMYSIVTGLLACFWSFITYGIITLRVSDNVSKQTDPLPSAGSGEPDAGWPVPVHHKLKRKHGQREASADRFHM